MAKRSSAKVIEFKKRKLNLLIDEKVDVILDRIANNVKKNIRDEVPVDTGNLREATVIGEKIKIGKQRGVNVGTDEDQAPYARYVYFPAGQHGFGTKTNRKRTYKGNDWISRAMIKTNARLPQIIAQVFLELNGIEI